MGSQCEGGEELFTSRSSEEVIKDYMLSAIFDDATRARALTVGGALRGMTGLVSLDGVQISCTGSVGSSGQESLRHVAARRTWLQM